MFNMIVHRWLSHMPAVACGSLSQHCQPLCTVQLTKFAAVRLLTQELFWSRLQLMIRLQSTQTW